MMTGLESTDKEELTNKEESVDLSDMQQKEQDDVVTEGAGLKIMTPNKLLTRLSILEEIKLEQIHKN